MKNSSLLSLIVGSLIGLALNSCALEPMEVPAKEIYTRNFIKTFGLIDQKQDWNLAERSFVKVNTAGPTDVKIYAYIDEAYYLVGHYSDVTSGAQLEFDAPKGTTRLLVSADGARVNAMVGQTVNLTDVYSRANGSYTDASFGTITVTELTDPSESANWLRLPATAALSYQNTLPEKRDNRDETFVVKNFTYVSTGPFIIHPIYWQTDQTNEIGIYVHCNASVDGAVQVRDYATGQDIYIKRMPVYTHKSDGTVFFKADKTDANVETVTDLQGNSTVYVKKDSESWTTVGAVQKLEDAMTKGGDDTYATGPTQFMSKGIRVDIPKGVEFGMYLMLSNPSTYTDEFGNEYSGKYLYSEAELNPDPYIHRTYPDDTRKHGTSTSSAKRPWQATHAASFRGEEYGALALMFEDWLDTGNSDMDLNDMVFVFFGNTPGRPDAGVPTIKPQETITASPYQWIIAAEDLGYLEDFDFNDVVVGVEYVSGETEAQLVALAAGGTLPVSLLYNGEVVGDEIFHHWFVGDPEETTMINTTALTTTAKGKVGLTVPSNFSIATKGVDDKLTANYASGKMGGFSLRVVREDGTYQEITPPGEGEAPQMICVPGGWAWPKEREDIRLAYRSFIDWVGESTSYDWYKSNYDLNRLIKAPEYSTGTSSGSGSGSTGGAATGDGHDYYVEAPTVATDGVRTPAAEGPIGYTTLKIDVSALSEDNDIVKAYKYLWMMPVNVTDGNYTFNEKYVESFGNAVLRHYWNGIFITAGDVINNNTVVIYTADNWQWDTPRIEDGKTCVLLEVLTAEPEIYGNTGSGKVNVKVKVQQVEPASTPGGGSTGGGNTGGGGDPTPSYGTELSVDAVGDLWDSTLYKITPPSDVTIAEGDIINIVPSASGSHRMQYGYTQDNPYLGTLEGLSAYETITVTSAYTDGIYIVIWSPSDCTFQAYKAD